MPGPSSDGRPSASSEPSVTSSDTLHSRYSAHADNEDGASSGHSSRGNDVQESPSRHSGSPLVSEAIDEHDFAHRRQRSGRAGGFLLDSTFPSAPKARQPARQPARQSAYIDGTTGKRSSRHGHAHSSRHAGRTHTGNGGSSSSPLSREVAVGDQEHENELRPPKLSKTPRDRSPLGPDRSLARPDEAPRAAIDPNQIVHMALNLSEGRRRNMSAGQLISPQPSSSRRVASIVLQQDGSVRDPGVGGSLRQYLNEQRRASRNISPMAKVKQPPSPACLARAQKAREFIELRLEYLRLLEYLPPLKPDAFAPGNFTVATTHVPGAPHAFLTHTPSYAGKKHELGRAYNPLQYLRNRRIRARERIGLEHTPEEFTDIDNVRSWVDRVERESKSPGYRRQDAVMLPKFHEDHPTEIAPCTPARPRMGWVFTNEELLADVNWLEQDGNKFLIEDRHGRKVFWREERQSQDFLQPRASKEYPEKRRKSWVDGLPGVLADPTTGDESDPISERGRKRRLLPAFRAESLRQKKHGWRGRAGSHSDSSDSESGSQKPRPKGSRTAVDTSITGALSLHLKDIVDQEAKEARAQSPALISPDTPDKWGFGQLDVVDSKSARSSMDTAGYSTTSGRGEFRSDDSSKGQRQSLDLPGTDKRRNNRLVEDIAGAVKPPPLHKKNDSLNSLNSPDNRKDYKEPKEPASAVTRFFKGMKSEGTKVGEFIFRRDRPAEDSDSDSDLDSNDHMTDNSLTDEYTTKEDRKFASTQQLLRSGISTATGSTTPKDVDRYHVELPTFRSQLDPENLTDDHVTNQARSRANSRSPRFDRLAPLRMDLGSLSARSSPAQSRTQSPDAGVDRTYKTLTDPSIVRHGDLPTIHIDSQYSDTLSRQPSLSLSSKPEGRHWSIADGNENTLQRTASATIVTPSDIARVRALFLCSGVKAREIARRSHEMRTNNPPTFLFAAAAAANADLIPIPRREEHALAARILVRNLEASSQALQLSASTFRNDKIKDLTTMINGLKSRVESEHFPRVRNSGDEALRITSEVSAQAPLSVKQVLDEIDSMIRMRRRRMRWVRRIGWMLVEWMLLGVMWWAWLIVVVLGFVKRVLGCGWSVVRWLLWI